MKGNERWLDMTSDSPHVVFNTACFWGDINCGREGDECVGQAAETGGVVADPRAGPAQG